MAANRALAARSIHVRIAPRPSSLSESREILSVLGRFGELTMFKYMKYEYQNPMNNVALAIFRDSHAAQQALNASPIRFTLEAVDPIESEQAHNLAPEAGDLDGSPNTAHDNIDDILRPPRLLPHTLSSVVPSPPTAAGGSMPFDASTPVTPRKVGHKPFLLILDHSRAVHADFVERQPYYKQFHPMRSLAQQDLAHHVPHPGLSDVSKRPPGAFRTPIRVLGIMREYVDRAMPSLKAISEGRGGGSGERRGRRAK
ncbi:hypothetical protein T440DRAFT_487512 [Plenodomus tracheiphilus IPT5]|uniref:Uncharacterized protein n=1 Tax=Plenodomus tracheiphilus IPT5 TaxID=1408161 RepID=A0A6A7BG07_9PLEO|nr:hypothetical protein T440DRAFT_487512 [Plenodomus tracheiphilus IPT5]